MGPEAPQVTRHTPGSCWQLCWGGSDGQKPGGGAQAGDKGPSGAAPNQGRCRPASARSPPAAPHPLCTWSPEASAMASSWVSTICSPAGQQGTRPALWGRWRTRPCTRGPHQQAGLSHPGPRGARGHMGECPHVPRAHSDVSILSPAPHALLLTHGPSIRPLSSDTGQHPHSLLSSTPRVLWWAPSPRATPLTRPPSVSGCPSPGRWGSWAPLSRQMWTCHCPTTTCQTR